MRKPLFFSAFLVLPLAATAQVFDFEIFSATGGNYSSPGGLNAVSHTVSGVTVTISRENNATLDIMDWSTMQGAPFAMPASWGNKGLSPFSDQSGSAFIATFSAPILFASIEFGDFGSDSDMVTLEGWSEAGATGSLVVDSTVDYGLGNLDSDGPETISINSNVAFQSIRFIGGSSGFPQSLYWDNLQFEAVPEPATLSLLGLGALAFLRKRSK